VNLWFSSGSSFGHVGNVSLKNQSSVCHVHIAVVTSNLQLTMCTADGKQLLTQLFGWLPERKTVIF